MKALNTLLIVVGLVFICGGWFDTYYTKAYQATNRDVISVVVGCAMATMGYVGLQCGPRAPKDGG